MTATPITHPTLQPRPRSPQPTNKTSKRLRLSSPPAPWPISVHITPTLAVPCRPMHTSMPDNSPHELLTRLNRDGYLLFRSLLPRREVVEARRVIAEDLRAGGFVADATAGRAQGGNDGCLLIAPGKDKEGQGPNLLARQDLANHPSVLNVLEHASLQHLMSTLLNPPTSPPETTKVDSNNTTTTTQHTSPTRSDSLKTRDSVPSHPPARTHPYKWLRAVPTLLHTGPHRDATYFPPSTFPSLLTAWVPLGDLSPQLGTLVCATPSSQASADAADAADDEAIQLGADGTKSGWITDEERLGAMEWVTEGVRMGDVVVLGRERVHCSSVNMTGEWRLSCDTRWMRGKEDAEGDVDSGVGESSSGAECSSGTDGSSEAGE